MAQLTQDQLAFLKHHGIPLEKVFDASGMSTADWKSKMSAAGHWIAFGVTPCERAGHTLRERSGHCIQCEPKNISYLRRHDEPGTVYIAYSLSRKLLKVGTAQRTDRVEQLNTYRYGGASDWRKVHSVSCNRAGKVESNTHSMLAQHRTPGKYYKDGRYIECYELFSCDVETARKALDNAIKSINGHQAKSSQLEKQDFSAPDEKITASTSTSPKPASKQYNFTPDQIAFFTRHKIPLDRVFFAHGLASKDVRQKMQEGGYTVAVGVTPCDRGHTLKSRSGNCVQCNSAALAFQKRHEIPGFVYVASTNSNPRILKVGVTNDISDRQYMLNLFGYGGYSDWQIVYRKLVPRGGEVESRVHQSLRQYQHKTSYVKQGEWVDCTELFECDIDTAKGLIERFAGPTDAKANAPAAAPTTQARPILHLRKKDTDSTSEVHSAKTTGKTVSARV